MPRHSRQKSKTGVYHVMLRGINKQFIFNDEQDFMKMEKILRRVSSTSCSGTPKESCSIYAYCMMSNHLHILIEEQNDNLACIMKRIGVAYVSYYNKRNNRVGPLFQGRFKSEPVGSFDYFVSLLHYIHMNPVNAGLVSGPDKYKWSSWREYELPVHEASQGICSIGNSFDNLEWEQLRQIVLNPESPIQTAIDHETMTEKEARESLRHMLPHHVEAYDLATLPEVERNEILLQALRMGIGIRQLARLTGIGRMSIYRLSKRP